MPLCHFDSYNLWILKPTHLNRGRGIHVFRDLESLHKLIKQYCSGKTLDTYSKKKEKATEEVTELAQELTDEGCLDEPKLNQMDPAQPSDPQLQNSPNKKKARDDINANKVKFNAFVI